VTRLLLAFTAIAGVTALDAAFIPAVVIVVAGLWTFSALDRRDPLLD
jgi:predicted metal-binding membrane protein